MKCEKNLTGMFVSEIESDYFELIIAFFPQKDYEAQLWSIFTFHTTPHRLDLDDMLFYSDIDLIIRKQE